MDRLPRKHGLAAARQTTVVASARGVSASRFHPLSLKEADMFVRFL
jgi:hypothetical protein